MNNSIYLGTPHDITYKSIFPLSMMKVEVINMRKRIEVRTTIGDSLEKVKKFLKIKF